MNNETPSANLVSQLISHDSGITNESLKSQRERLDGSISAMQGLSHYGRKALMTAIFAVVICICIGLISPIVEQVLRDYVSESSYAPMIAKYIMLLLVVVVGLFAALLFVVSFRSWYILKPIHESQRWQLQAAILRHLQERVDAIESKLNEVKS